MTSDKNIKSYTAKDLTQMRKQGDSKTDWARVDTMTEDELETTIASEQDWQDVPREWYADAELVIPSGPKQQVTLRLDADVLAWFKAQGKGYQTRINAVLREFMRLQRRRQREGQTSNR